MVSIIMPVKNAATYLRECLDSILSQSLLDWELMAVDDHSTDGSASILRSYSTKDKRIRFFENDGNGIIDALRLGYRRSYGEFITRMDADDIMPTFKLENLLRICVLEEHVVATAKVEYFSNAPLGDGYKRYSQWLNGMVDRGDHWEHVYKECVIPSPCWMMRREEFNAIGAFDSDRYPEDYDLVFRMYRAGMTVLCDDEVLHRWRDHGGRASRNDPNYNDNRFLEMKLDYFLDLDYKTDHFLNVWGAGDKGKWVAQELQRRGIEFNWLTDNPSKIGVDIYGKVLYEGKRNIDPLSNRQYIMCIASPADQKELKEVLSEQSEVFWFC